LINELEEKVTKLILENENLNEILVDKKRALGGQEFS